ncbi:MAG: hypothetical protein EA400_01180 [Chromatiaceae bacterium]|nr:MAG: hypothetical protein EA400_01180 [Chromatiaceae bacterium]
MGQHLGGFRCSFHVMARCAGSQFSLTAFCLLFNRLACLRQRFGSHWPASAALFSLAGGTTLHAWVLSLLVSAIGVFTSCD